jgi:hypothetical protein
MMKIGPNAPALDGLCIWMMQISSMYIGHEEDFNLHTNKQFAEIRLVRKY